MPGMGTLPASTPTPTPARQTSLPTCQCCGRAIKLRGKVIALHGYQRPCWGVQTRSCYGAGYQPYAVARDGLVAMLVSLQRSVAALAQDVAAMRDTPVPVLVREGRTAMRPVWCQPTSALYPMRQREWFQRQATRMAGLVCEQAFAQQRYDAWKAPFPA